MRIQLFSESMLRVSGSVLVAFCLGGCASFGQFFDDTVGYGFQALGGHLGVLARARSIDEWIASSDTPELLRERLGLVREIRGFSSSRLGLPDNRSYATYADLKRPYVVWNVFATPELSLTLDTWCFPIVGCIGYRGYYDQRDAQRFAERLRGQGRDVHVAGIPAYSTLGLTPDPVLNTFLNWPDGELARLLFHELAHQVVYVRDDSTFNESFATAVEQAGVERWLSGRDAVTRERYAIYDGRRREFLALLRDARKRLEAVYADSRDDDEKRAAKRLLQERLRAEYRQLRDHRWEGYAGYDHFFASALNNAQLAAVGAYDDLVPGFRALLAAEGGDLPKFYRTVRALAEREREDRRRILNTAAAAAATAAEGSGG